MLAGVFLPVLLVFLDLIWTRTLQGQALTPFEAQLLDLAPAVAVDVELLSPQLRHAVATRTLWGMGGLLLPVLLCGFGLWYYQVWILQRLNHSLRLRLFDQLHLLSLRFHADNQVGDLVYRLYQDSAMVTRVIQVLFLTSRGTHPHPH